MRSSRPGPAGIAFRVDGSAAVGAGHLTRCRSLAHELRAAGARVGFVIGSASAEHAGALTGEGFAVCTIADARLDELDAADVAATAAACHGWGAAAVVVDHYGATSAYLQELVEAGLLVGAIDDLGDRDLRAAAWILNQNLGADASLYGLAEGRTILLGAGYALLRPQFASARDTSTRRFAEGDSHVLVTFGGGAPASLYAETVEALRPAGRPLDVRVLTGSPEVVDAGLVEAAAASPHRVEIAGRVDRMADQIVWADVVVGAGGSTCWELLALGAPSVVVSLSRDQRPNVAALADADLAIPFATGDLGGACDAVVGLLGNPAGREAMSYRGRTVVDGRGAGRAAASLLAWAAGEATRAAA